MIKTKKENRIDHQTLAEILAQAVNSEAINAHPVTIECCQQEDNLVITVHHPQDNDFDSQTILSLINGIIAEQEIINEVRIDLVADTNSISNTEQSSTNDNDSPADNDELSDDNQTISLTDDSSVKKYQSKNFSVGFISFVSGLVVIGIAAIIYSFTRPCVLGECNSITEIQTTITNTLQSVDADTNLKDLNNIQAQINESSQQLNRIPFWSKYHNSAQDLIKQYQQNNQDIQQLLNALELEENAKSMSQKLPLSPEEWQRVITFWQDAANILESSNYRYFDLLVSEKLIVYQNEIQTAKERIKQERLAEKQLAEAQDLAEQNINQKAQVNSLNDLRDLEKDWRSAIEKVETIPVSTIADQQKDQLLNNYSQELLAVQQKIRQEQAAVHYLEKIKEKVNLAQKSQQNNQWTRAVSYWQEATKLLDNAPENTFLITDFTNLEQETTDELKQAKAELKLAVVRENIRNDLKKICNSSQSMCNYSVTDDLIKVYLTDNYLKNIAKISAQSSLRQKQQLDQHITQVDKNYQFISLKYQKPLQVYNPQKQLIVRY